MRECGKLTCYSGAMRKLTLRNQKGFTLIELLAVMAIVAVLAGIISVAVAGSGQTSRDTQTKQDGTTVETAVANYFGNQQGTETRQPLVVEVLGQRNIEEVMIEFIKEYCRKNKIKEIHGKYIKTKKNSLFFEFFNKLNLIDSKKHEDFLRYGDRPELPSKK